MEFTINRVEPRNLIVEGTEYSLLSKDDGTVYISSKGMMDKLFRMMGYKSVKVVSILEEYANKCIENIGNVSPCEVYIDDQNTLVVASPESVENAKSLISDLYRSDLLEVVEYRSSISREWDEIIVRRTKDNRLFAVYLSLLYEEVDMSEILIDEESKSVRMISSIGKFKLSNDEENEYESIGFNCVSDIMISLLNDGVADIEAESIREYVSLSVSELSSILVSADILKKDRRKYVFTDESYEDKVPIDTINSVNRITKYTTPTIKFSEACKIVYSAMKKGISLSEFRWLYKNNISESMDADLTE